MTTLASIQELYEQIETSAPQKDQAFERFKGLGLPTKKWEAYRYAPLSKVFNEKWQLPGKRGQTTVDRSAAVFIDGVFSPELSTLPKEIIALPLKDAMKSYGALLNRRFETEILSDTDPFVLLNYALYQEGLFLYLPPKVALSAPLEFHFVQLGQNVVSTPRIDLFVGKEASLTTLTTFAPGTMRFWNNSVFHVSLEQGASHSHYDDGSDVVQGLSFQATRATLKRDSSFSLFSFGGGAASTRHDILVRLTEENASATLKGLFLVEPRGKVNSQIEVRHEAPNARSYQHYKSAVADSGESSFAGKIHVAQIAQQTDAYQLCNHLLLGEQAKGMSQPNLEVLADDVKASHGATCALLNEEELFYFRARGVSREAASKLLVKGFCLELSQNVTLHSLKSKIDERVEAFTHG